MGVPSRRVRRHRVERRLRAQLAAATAEEERLRLSIDVAPIGVAFVDLDGRFLRVNEALCELVGYERGALLDLRFQQVTHPDDLDADLALLRRTLAGEVDRYRLEKRYVRRDGSVLHAQLDVSLVRDADGAPLHFISQLQDVTERVRTMEALLATQAVQRASLDALEQGVGVMDLTGEVILLNRAGAEIIGYDAETLSQRAKTRLWSSYTEDGRELDRDDRPLVHTLTTGEPVTEKVIGWARPDGQLRTLRLATQPVHDEHGAMTAMVVAFTDITEQRRAEQAEREARALLEWQAFHDSLTELPNRAFLLGQLQEQLDRRPGAPVALLFLDLDDFKAVNDSMGHQAGDELLVAVGDRLRRAVREGDVVARFGGDEFVVLAPEVRTLDGARQLAERVAAAFERPVPVRGQAVALSASIGVVVDRGRSADALLRRADDALYQAKGDGGGHYRVDHVPAGRPTPPSVARVAPGR